MSTSPSAQLNPTQQQTLQEFIQAFLPPRGNKRKSTRNELKRLSLTLHRVLLKYFGFGVESPQVLYTFQQLGYAVYTKQSDWHPERKQWVPASPGTNVRVEAPYEQKQAADIYLDVEATVVQQLWLLTQELPSNTKPDKLRQRDAWHARIQAWQCR